MFSAKDAKIILKDKCIESIMASTSPRYVIAKGDDDDYEEYLSTVYRSLKNLRAYLRKAAKDEKVRRKK